MINTEETARIACSFIAAFYKGFVEDLPSLARFYSEQSSTSFARVDEAVATTSQGKAQVLQYLERLNADLGPRKVEVRTADFVPTTDGSLAITVTGVIFTKRLRQGFTQTFVLSSTKYKENTLFISADSLRLVSREKEVIPANAIIVAPGEELTLSVVSTNAAAPTKGPDAERKERPPRERKERKPRAEKEISEGPKEVAPPVAQDVRPLRERKAREERKPREPKPQAEAPQTVPKVEERKPREDKPREDKPREDRKPRAVKDEVKTETQVAATKPSWAGLVSGKAQQVEAPKIAAPAAKTAPAEKKSQDKPIAAPAEKKETVTKVASKVAPGAAVAASATSAAPVAASAKDTAPVRERTLTSKVKLLNVPKEILLSEVRAAASKYGKVSDAFWRDDDAVVVLETPEEARAFQSDRSFAVKDIKIRRFYFFEN